MTPEKNQKEGKNGPIEGQNQGETGLSEKRSSRFVRPEVDRLEISGGDWLEVRRRLNTGEFHDALRGMGKHGVFVPEAAESEIVAAYLVDWSLTGADGNPVVIRDQPREVVSAALSALDPVDFKEILKAIQEHETRVTTNLRPVVS